MLKFRYRDKKLAEAIVQKLKRMSIKAKLMHVCGTHQDTLIHYGLDALLKQTGIEIVQGPGCPVCVTTPKEIEEALLLAKRGKTVAMYGDMLKVPGRVESPFSLRASSGADIRICYSIDDAIALAKNERSKEVVFMAVGFETTAPSTASALSTELPENFAVLCCHRFVPPALKALIELGEVKLNGLIEPGHVSTVIGAKPYEFLSTHYKIPQVIAGFEPLDLLMAVYMLANQIKNNSAKLEIEYTRSVRYNGNVKAVSLMNDVFIPCDVAWRGFPVIPNSGMELKKKFEHYDARKLYEDELAELDNIEFKEPKGCKCGEVLRGLIYSDECPLFRKVCTPQNPIGPCMVSTEGSCNITYKYEEMRD